MRTQNKSRIAQYLSTATIPQSQPLDKTMIKNNAGGFSYEVGIWDQLTRFLILGTYGGTYYVSERDLTKLNVDVLEKCLKADSAKYAQIVAQVSLDGRAAKNDFAVFALAFAAAKDINNSRLEALSHLNEVCRIGTHLFQFLEDYKALGGGWGRSVRRAVANWYTSKQADKLAHQLVKYRNRNGWTHKDAIRQSHAKSSDLNHVLRYAVKGWEGEVAYPDAINAYELLKTASVDEAVQIVRKYDVTREFVPTQMLTEPKVMAELSMKMPVNAMIRNLGNMSRVLDWKPTTKSESLERTIAQLKDKEALKNGRVHPMFVLTALKQYEMGRGMSSTWDVHPKVSSALNDSFRLSVKSVEPTKLKMLVAVDTSGSMHTPAGANFQSYEAAAAMALVVASTEPYVRCMDFNTRVHNDNVVLHENMTVEQATRAFTGSGGTDLALPVTWALSQKEEYDLVMILSDNETWAGTRHLQDAWKEYRKLHPQAKLVIASTAANQHTVGDPSDSSVLQTVGFDANLLEIVKVWATS